MAVGLLFAWRLNRNSSRPISPEALAYPVLLIDEDRISEVCSNESELTTRPESHDHIIEQRFRVIDALGRLYRIENYRLAEPKPSTFSRVFSATVYSTLYFKTAFDLRPGRLLWRREVLTQLRDWDWEIPNSDADYLKLYLDYRADRYQQFGNYRDRPLSDGANP